MKISFSLLLFLYLLIFSCDCGQFWHISDLHLDHSYVSGGNISNWCHQSTVSGDITNNDEVGPAGNYHCDSPELLVESSLKAMHTINPTPDFIVWTGDSAPHWRKPAPPSEKYIVDVTKWVFTKLDQLFPEVPVIAALGNHDASPPDQFPIAQSNDSNMPDYYVKLWKNGAFGDHINTTKAMQTFQQCGFYTKVISPKSVSYKLRFVVLNTNIYYHDNLTSGEDPCGQLEWLKNTLKKSDEKEERLFLVAHVPPGSFERQPGKSNFNSPKKFTNEIHKKFIQIVTDPLITHKITAHLYGHLHTDTFRIFLDRATRKRAVGVAFMAGSVTPILWVNNEIVGVNPTIRLMDFDKHATMVDFSVYNLDISKPMSNKIGLTDVESNSGAKSRRKEAKFRKLSKSKRESLDDHNPADSVNSLPKKAESFEGNSTINPSKTLKNNSLQEFATIVAVPTPAPTGITSSSNQKAVSSDLNNESPTKILSNTSDVIEQVGSESNKTSDIAIKSNSPQKDSFNSTESGKQKTESDAGTVKELATNTNQSYHDQPKVDSATTYVDHNTLVEELSQKWTFLYKASEAFNVTDLTPDSMLIAFKTMVKNDIKSDMFTMYYQHNTGSHIAGDCNNTCWREHLCAISNIDVDELTTCLSSTGKEGFYYEGSPIAHNKSLNEAINSIEPLDMSQHESGTDTLHSNVSYTINQIDHSKEDLVIGSTDKLNSKVSDVNHAKMFPTPEQEVVSKKKLEDDVSSISSRAVAIFFGLLGVAILVLIALLGYKKYRDNRYRNQEFLLTDAVFRYDGYSQLDDA